MVGVAASVLDLVGGAVPQNLIHRIVSDQGDGDGNGLVVGGRDDIVVIHFELQVVGG